MASFRAGPSVWPSSSTLTDEAGRNNDGSGGGSSGIRARLILIRHPHTIANAAGVLQGSTDSPLSDLGQRQLDRLCACIEAEWSDEDLPSVIVHSPLGRCRTLAARVAEVVDRRLEAAQRGSSSNGADDSSIHDDATVKGVKHGGVNTRQHPTVTLLPSLDLQEKSFGPAECTRRGVHAGPAFPRAQPGSRRESEEDFRMRVRRAGKMWIAKAVEMTTAESKSEDDAEESARDTRQAEHKSTGTIGASAGTDVIDNADADVDSITQRSRPRPLLIVTHGLWLSTFFKLFLGGSTPAFASNTGMYLLDVLASTSPTSIYRLRLLRANWTPHFDESTSSSSSSRSSASALRRAGADPKQKKLSSFFGQASPTSSPSKSRADALKRAPVQNDDNGDDRGEEHLEEEGQSTPLLNEAKRQRLDDDEAVH
ncbi:unnamed protein product [Jaminaea pallidilutea]